MPLIKPPLTPAEHIVRAKEELASGAEPGYATAHALIAIAEVMATNMTDALIDATTRGAVAATEALGSIFGMVYPGATIEHIERLDHHCEYDNPSKCAWPGHRR